MSEKASTPRAFVLQRHEDVSGVSGTGVVAWGVEFPDGVVALRWCSAWPTSVVFHDRGIAGVRAVHGHDGRTQIVYVDSTMRAWEQLGEEVAERSGYSANPDWIGTSHITLVRAYLDELNETIYDLRQKMRPDNPPSLSEPPADQGT